MHFAERRKIKTFVLKKDAHLLKLLDVNWSNCPELARPERATKHIKRNLGVPFCNGHNCDYMLEYLEGGECSSTTLLQQLQTVKQHLKGNLLG
jgi:hypothetical protein